MKKKAVFVVLGLLLFLISAIPVDSIYINAEAASDIFETKMPDDKSVASSTDQIIVGKINVYLDDHCDIWVYSDVHVKAYSDLEGTAAGLPGSRWITLTAKVKFYDKTSLWGGTFKAWIDVYKMRSGGDPNDPDDYVKQPRGQYWKVEWTTGTLWTGDSGTLYLHYEEDFEETEYGPVYYRCKLCGEFDDDGSKCRTTKPYVKVYVPVSYYDQTLYDVECPSPVYMSTQVSQHPFTISGKVGTSPEGGDVSNILVKVTITLENGDIYVEDDTTDSTGYWEVTFIIWVKDGGRGTAEVEIQDQKKQSFDPIYRESYGYTTSTEVKVWQGLEWFEINKWIEVLGRIARETIITLYAIIASYNFTGTVNLDVLDVPSGIDCQFDPTWTFNEPNVAISVPLVFSASEYAPLGNHEITLKVTGSDVKNCSFILSVLISVGGICIPVDRFGLLAPYICFASTIAVATAAAAIYVKRVKRRKKKQ